MLGREHRFHGHNSVRAVYSRGRQVRGTALSLRYATRQGNRPYRVAVVVSRKVHKSAVVRNRIRRRIYEIVRTQVALHEGEDCVLTAYNDTLATMDYDMLRSNVAALFAKRVTGDARAIVDERK